MVIIKFAEEKCKGCQLCILACPKQLLKPADSLNALGYLPVTISDRAQCTGCSLCAQVCPDCVISIYRD